MIHRQLFWALAKVAVEELLEEWGAVDFCEVHHVDGRLNMIALDRTVVCKFGLSCMYVWPSLHRAACLRANGYALHLTHPFALEKTKQRVAGMCGPLLVVLRSIKIDRMQILFAFVAQNILTSTLKICPFSVIVFGANKCNLKLRFGLHDDVAHIVGVFADVLLFWRTFLGGRRREPIRRLHEIFNSVN